MSLSTTIRLNKIPEVNTSRKISNLFEKEIVLSQPQSGETKLNSKCREN